MATVRDASTSAAPTRLPAPPSNALGVRWDLSAIHRGPAQARAELSRLEADAIAFRTRYEGRIAGLSPAGLAALLSELGALTNRRRATSAYCKLRSSVDGRVKENRDLTTAAALAGARVANRTRVFEVEWRALGQDKARALAWAPEVQSNRHFLEKLTAQGAHTVSAEEEQALAERSPAAIAAWQQLFSYTMSAVTVDFRADQGSEAANTIDEVLAYLYDDRPTVRKTALEALYAALEPLAPTVARVYDTLVGDRLAMDRLRHFVRPGNLSEPLPMQQTNLANDLPDEVVDTMIEAVVSRYHIAQDYFSAKARQMEVTRLPLSDLCAPMATSRSYSFDESRRLVLDAAGAFSPKAELILSKFFDERRVDAEPRPGKQPGAFCEIVSQDKPAYVLLNHTDSAQNCYTLAHELGHGLHAALAQRKQSPFTFDSGPALAEVAATFNEFLLFHNILEGERDKEARRELIRSRVESSCETIFGQTMMTRYEQRTYAEKSAGACLTSDLLSQIWVEESHKYTGGTVEVSEGYRWAWSYIPQFIYTRFYSCAYVFAHLVSLALYPSYMANRSRFAERYLSVLGAGGSESPKTLLSSLGIDISDPDWVVPGFDLLTSWIDLVDDADASPTRTDPFGP